MAEPLEPALPSTSPTPESLAEYAERLEPYKIRLGDLRRREKDAAAEVLQAEARLDDGSIGIWPDNLYFAISAERSMRLIDGLAPVLEQRNLACVDALLRMQVDTCLRTYAPFIANDKDAFFSGFLKDERLDKQLADDGERMTDRHLVERLGKYDDRLEAVYNSTCGFIRLSGALLPLAGAPVDGKDHEVVFNFGGEPNARLDPFLLESAAAFCHYTELHLKLLHRVVIGSGHGEGGNQP